MHIPILTILFTLVTSTPINGSAFKTKIGWVNLLVLNGDFETMGEQYGYLMKDEILYTYEYLIETLLIKEGKFTYDELIKILYEDIHESLSYRQQLLFAGMSTGSNISYQKLIMLDQVNIAFVMKTLEFGCSFGSISYFTDDTHTILGRSFDWFKDFTKINDLLTVVVYNGIDSNSVATIGYPGWIGAITGINENGLYLSLNSGLSAMGTTFYTDRGSYLNELFEVLLDSSTLWGMRRRIYQIKPNFANMVNIADTDRAYSIENTPFETKIRNTNLGVIVSTNNYMDPLWGNIQVETSTFSLKRYSNMISLMNNLVNNETKHPGIIEFLRVFEYPLQYNNYTFANGVVEYFPPTKTGNSLTIYTVVVKPKDRVIYLRIPSCENCNWQQIDLNKYFP